MVQLFCKKNLLDLYKADHTYTYPMTSGHTPGYLPEGKERMCLQKDLCTNVHSSVSEYSKLKTAQKNGYAHCYVFIKQHATEQRKSTNNNINKSRKHYAV